MLSVRPNFCPKPPKAFPCENHLLSIYTPKWTNTYAVVCTPHDKDIVLSHQSFFASITIVILTKKAIQLTSLLIGPKTATKINTKEISSNSSLLFYQKLI
jgi:hypothetical protein